MTFLFCHHNEERVAMKPVKFRAKNQFFIDGRSAIVLYALQAALPNRANSIVILYDFIPIQFFERKTLHTTIITRTVIYTGC